MPTSRIAYLIQAHNDAPHLARMIDALDVDAADYYVHIDAKSDIESFSRLFNRRGVTFLREREKVYWGGFSQVRATLRLLRAALNVGYARYALMSGCDFPIKSAPTIRDTLLDSKREYLCVERRLDERPRNGHAMFVDHYHLNDWELFNPRVARRYRERRGTPLLSNVARTAAHAMVRGAFVVGRAALPRRRYVSGMVPYQGSSWWSLTDACVRFALDFIARRPEYVRFHQLTSSPDEIFFHSIVKTSPFAEQISHDFERAAIVGNDSGAHYIDWRAKNVPLPKTLDESDFGALMASEALFARKFDSRTSAGLLAMLEQRLR
jgi:hypothetical protein